MKDVGSPVPQASAAVLQHTQDEYSWGRQSQDLGKLLGKTSIGLVGHLFCLLPSVEGLLDSREQKRNVTHLKIILASVSRMDQGRGVQRS